MKNIALALVVAATGLLAVPAQAYDLFIVNHTSVTITNVWASPGKVQDFKRIPFGSNRRFDITMPSGKCETTLTISFEDGQSGSLRANVCGGFKLTYNERPEGH